jgi:hypothetical protein
MSSMLAAVTNDEYYDELAAFCVHSTAFCLTNAAPSSSPSLCSISSHFLKKDLVKSQKAQGFVEQDAYFAL